jgi:acyl carrier protein
MDVKETINEIILEVLSGKINSEDLKPEKHLIYDLGAESMQLLEIALSIAAEFNIEVPKTEVSKIRTLEDLYLFVANKKGVKL